MGDVSGIVGILRRDGRPADPATATAMLDPTEHRGPDGCDVVGVGPTAMGQARLATVPDGHWAPLPRRDGDLVLTADARLDNRRALCASLELETPETTPDGAIITAAYREWGRNCVDRFVGAFAFALYDQGYDVLADDVTAVATDTMSVRPAYPGLKLSPSAASAFDSFDAPQSADEFDDSDRPRRFYRVADGFPETGVPLERVYVLTDDADVPGQALKPGAAVHELSRATFAPSGTDEQRDAAERFREQVALASSVPVEAVTFPDSIDRLPSAIDAIEADCQ